MTRRGCNLRWPGDYKSPIQPRGLCLRGPEIVSPEIYYIFVGFKNHLGPDSCTLYIMELQADRILGEIAELLDEKYSARSCGRMQHTMQALELEDAIEAVSKLLRKPTTAYALRSAVLMLDEVIESDYKHKLLLWRGGCTDITFEARQEADKDNAKLAKLQTQFDKLVQKIARSLETPLPKKKVAAATTNPKLQRRQRLVK